MDSNFNINVLITALSPIISIGLLFASIRWSIKRTDDLRNDLTRHLGNLPTKKEIQLMLSNLELEAAKRNRGFFSKADDAEKRRCLRIVQNQKKLARILESMAPNVDGLREIRDLVDDTESDIMLDTMDDSA